MSTSVGVISLDLTLNGKIEEQIKSITKGIANKFSGSMEAVNTNLEKSITKPFESMKKAAEKSTKSITKPFESAEKAADKTASSVKETFESSYSDIESAVNKCISRMEKEQEKLKKSASGITVDAGANSQTNDNANATVKSSATAIPAPSLDELDKYASKATEQAEKLAESFRASTNPVELLNQKLDVTYAKIGDAQREADELFAKYNQIANAKGANSDEAMAVDKAFTSAQDKLIRLQEQASRTESKLNEAISKTAQKTSQAANSAGSQVQKVASSAGSAVKNKLGAQINQTASSASKVNSRFGKIKTTLSKVGNAGKTAFSKLRSHLKSTDKSAKSTNGLFQKLGKTIKGVFKATFITAGLYAGFRALKSLFSDAMKQSSEFQKSLNSLKANFKIAFQPVISTVLPILTKLINKLSQVMASVASFISGIFGTTYEKSKQAAKEASQTAKKSSEEAQKYLNSYDVMNKAQDTSSDSDDEGIDFDAIDTTGSKAAETLGTKFKKIMSELFTPIKNAWDKHGQPVMDSIKTTGGQIKNLFKDIGKDFKDVWTDGTGEKYVSSLLKLVKSVVTTVGKIADAFDRAWKQGDKGKKLFKSLLDSGRKVNKLFKAISDSIGKAFDSPAGTTFFSNILSIITNISDTIGNLAGQFTEAWENAGLGDSIMLNLLNLVNSITGFVDRITGSLAKWAGELDFTPLLESINSLLEGFTSLSNAVGGVLGDAFETVLLPLASWTMEEAGPAAIETFSGLLDALGTIINTIRPGLQTFYDKVLKPIGSWAGDVIIGALGKLKNLFSTVAGVFSEKGSKIQNIISGISSGIKKAWEFIKPYLDIIKTAVGNAFDIMSETIGGTLSGVIDALSGLIDFIKDVFKGDWKAAWNDIKNIVKGVWDGIWSIIKGIINAIINGINLLWKGIYRAISGIINCVGEVAGVIGDLFGQDWHFEMPENPPTIPKLAKGGLATAPTLAMVGDNKNAKSDPEVISPLSKLKGMLDEGSSDSEIVALLKEILAFLRSINFEFNGSIDKNVLYKCIVDLNKSNTNRTGVNALA